MGFSGGSAVKNLCNTGDTGDMDSILGLGTPLGEEMANLPSVLAWETLDRVSLASHSAWFRQEVDTT